MATKKTTKKVATKQSIKKSITPALIEAVIEGAYGEGDERKTKLREDGYIPSAVTKKISDLNKLIPELKAVFMKAGVYAPVLFVILDKEARKAQGE